MAAAGIPPVEESWSDDKCIEIANGDNFPSAVKDISVQKSIIDRFLNFYLRGKPQKGFTVTDVTFAVISIMPLHDNTEQFIFHPSYYKDDGTLFFLTAEEKLKADIDDIKPKDGQEHNIDDNSKPEAIETKGQSNETTDTFRCIHVEEHHYERDSEKIVDDDKITAKEINNSNTEYSKNKPHDKQTDNVTHDDQQQTKQGTTRETTKNNIPKLPCDMIRYKKKPKSSEEIRPQYGPVENAAFIISCNKLLDEWDTNQKARIILKYFFGIVALILMRTTTKKYMHLVNTFGGNKFLTTISFAGNYINYSVPHKKCFKNCYRIFSKRDGNIPIMFAKIVGGSFYIEALRKELPQDDKLSMILRLNIFKFALLAHTADYGFGLVCMVQNLHDQFGDINLVIETTYCAETAESWCRLKNFIEKYMTRETLVATYRWARVISTRYFRDISCSTNYELSVILAVFTEKATNSSDVWKSSWVQNVENLDALKTMGLDMYEKFRAKDNLKRMDRMKSCTDDFDLRALEDFLNNIEEENPEFDSEEFGLNYEDQFECEFDFNEETQFEFDYFG